MPRSATTFGRDRQPARRGKRSGPGKATKEIKEFFSEFYSSKEYRARLQERIMKGKAMPIETLGYYYLCGKPKERVQLIGAEGEALTHDGLIEALVVRFTRLATARHIGQRIAEAEAGANRGPILVVGSSGATESASSNGHVDDLVSMRGEGLRENTVRSGDDTGVGSEGG